MLGPDQKLDPAAPALLVEEGEAVALAVAEADDACPPGQIAGEFDGVGQAIHPALCPGLPQTPHTSPAGGVVEATAQDTGRVAAPVDREGRVQMQPERPGSGLVAADYLEPRAAGPGGEVQVGAILDAEHRLLAAHPLPGPLPVHSSNHIPKGLDPVPPFVKTTT